MPRLMGQDDSTMEQGTIGNTGFGFTGTRIDKLESTSYTLATLLIDASGSVGPFARQLDEMLQTVIKACKLSPRSDNILVRVLAFNTTFRPNVDEIHGFKPIADIDVDGYAPIQPGGGTPLYDATFSAVGATIAYGQQLRALEYTINAIVCIVTDGEDTNHTATPRMIKAEIDKVLVGEELESMVTILIGINTAHCRASLDTFQTEAGLTHFIDAGNATPQVIGKVAGFIIDSISSTSVALGTGGPSQQIPAVI